MSAVNLGLGLIAFLFLLAGAFIAHHEIRRNERRRAALYLRERGKWWKGVHSREAADSLFAAADHIERDYPQGWD